MLCQRRFPVDGQTPNYSLELAIGLTGAKHPDQPICGVTHVLRFQLRPLGPV